MSKGQDLPHATVIYFLLAMKLAGECIIFARDLVERTEYRLPPSCTSNTALAAIRDHFDISTLFYYYVPLHPYTQLRCTEWAICHHFRLT